MKMNGATRERSRSPGSLQEIKLHVSNLPVQLEQSALEAAFEPYGEIQSTRIIRKGANGQPLKDFVYGFVVLLTGCPAHRVIESLKQQGWCVSMSKKPSETVEPNKVVSQMASFGALMHNYQATMSMLMTLPGAAVNPAVVSRLLEENHPSVCNMPKVHPMFPEGYLVREIWVGNISSTMGTRSLYESFSQFGKIEGIEMFNSKGFAFIKFKQIVEATLAYERGQGLVLENKGVKIAFADPTRRIDIIGDSTTPDDPSFNPIDDEFFKTLYVGYSGGTVPPSETVMKAVFSKYGTVSGVYVKQGNSTTKPYAFIDFERGEQAAAARIGLYIEDTLGIKRAELGDPALEISFKNTTKSVNKHGVKNGVRYVDKSLHVDVKGLAQKLLQNPSNIVPHLQTFSTLHAAPLSRAVGPCASLVPTVEQPQEIWSGFMSRNKKNRVGIDMSLIKGRDDCISSDIYHLNITHRVTLSEINKYEVVGVVSLEASNDTQLGEFNNYILYFKAKQRAGYIPLKKYVLYVVPQVAEALQVHPELQPAQLLGVFVDPSKKLQLTNS